MRVSLRKEGFLNAIVDKKKWVSREAKPLASGLAFHGNVEDMSTEECVAAYSILYFFHKKCEDRIKQLRDHLIAEAETRGEPTEKGGNLLHVDGAEVIRQKRVATLPDQNGIQNLLEARQLPLVNAFDLVQSWVMNPSKLESLINTGHLKRDEVESLKTVTWALQVKPATDLKCMLELAASESSVPLLESGKKKKTVSKRK